MSPVVLAMVACVAGIVGNLWSVYAAASLRHAPRGVSIRPMNLYGVLLLIAFGTFIVSFPLAVMGIIVGWRRAGVWLACGIGVILSVTPIFVSNWVMDWIVVRYGLILGD